MCRKAVPTPSRVIHSRPTSDRASNLPTTTPPLAPPTPPAHGSAKRQRVDCSISALPPNFPTPPLRRLGSWRAVLFNHHYLVAGGYAGRARLAACLAMLFNHYALCRGPVPHDANGCARAVSANLDCLLYSSTALAPVMRKQVSQTLQLRGR